jgi:DNA invertase Pin-like site-specific DNA recombinase
MKEGIAYVRFSSEEQSEGHSIERQLDNVKAYCARSEIKISETLIDEGLSAFKGTHLSEGKLGLFLEEVDRGQHHGKALIIEHMDRLSRLGIAGTNDLLGRLHKGQVEVHITQENRVVRSADDLLTALQNIISAHFANDYSQKLKERVGAAWNKKKHQHQNGIAITSITPAWLIGEVGHPFGINEERAAIVREIFRLAETGLGKRLIARSLNERGVPTWGRSKIWAHSSVGDILVNRAVLGEYQPFTGKRADRKPDGEPRPGFYPAVIDIALWKRVQDTLAGRKSGQFAGRTGKARNLFSGLVYDVTGEAPEPMHYIDKGTKSTRNLSTVKTNGEKPQTVNYARFERGFLEFLDALDWRRILNAEDRAEIHALESEDATIREGIDQAEGKMQKIIDLLVDTPSQALKDRLAKLESQVQADHARLQDVSYKLETLRRKNMDLLDNSVTFSKLSDCKDVETRMRLRQEIRRKVNRIEFLAFNSPFIKGPDWPEDQTAAVVRFVNGARRVIVLTATGITATGELP